MKKSAVVLALTLVFAVSAISAQAGPVKRRLHRQHERIAQGVRSGQLTRREAAGLRHDQRGIREERREFLAKGGRFGPAERARVRHDQNAESRRIYRLKHNDRDRD